MRIAAAILLVAAAFANVGVGCTTGLAGSVSTAVGVGMRVAEDDIVARLRAQGREVSDADRVALRKAGEAAQERGAGIVLLGLAYVVLAALQLAAAGLVVAGAGGRLAMGVAALGLVPAVASLAAGGTPGLYHGVALGAAVAAGLAGRGLWREARGAAPGGGGPGGEGPAPTPGGASPR